MTIAIDLTSLSYHLTGIERYATCITEEMLKQDTRNEYRLVFRNEIYPTFKKLIDNKRIKADVIYGDNKFLFLQYTLLKWLYGIKADKYLFFAFTSPIFFRRKGIYNTIHDMGAWDSSDSMTLFQKMYWRLTLRISAKVSAGIITVSEFSKKRISDILKYPNEKIFVAYSAVYKDVVKDYGYTFEDIKEKYHLPTNYIMTLSTLEPRKNIEILLKAFSNIQDKVDYDLVLVGRKGWKMENTLNKYNKKDRVHITGFVQDEHLSVIYKNARCFVFPSLYEGFGLPPVEALALGTPVLASNSASIPEILRNQAIYFEKSSINQLCDLLINLNKSVVDFPHELDDFQKNNYKFSESAKKIIRIIGDR